MSRSFCGRSVPEPHLPDVGHALVRGHVPRPEGTEDRERLELVRGCDVLDSEHRGRVPRHRRRQEEGREERDPESGSGGARSADSPPGGDEGDPDEDREGIVEEVERAVHQQETAWIQAAEETEHDQRDRGDEHRDDQIVRAIRRASKNLEAADGEGCEDEEGGENQ